MVLRNPGEEFHAENDWPVRAIGTHEVAIRVEASGICRTDLHILDGELPRPKLPLVPGHQVVGTVTANGAEAHRWRVGARVGVPWLGWTCGECRYCLSGRENLCDRARFTGYNQDGGFAEQLVADERYAFALPTSAEAASLAPWLCAGFVGYRALRAAGEAPRVGFYGFGAAARIAVQVAHSRGQLVHAFSRPGDVLAQEAAVRAGADWSGGSEDVPPAPLDGAVVFAPVGDLVLPALRATAKGGTVVCAGIHMSDLPSFPYRLLWGERVLRSVANLTRRDGEEFLELAAKTPIRTETTVFPLEQANDAVRRVRGGNIEGTAVLVP